MRETILPADPSWLPVGVDPVGVECDLSAILPVYFYIKKTPYNLHDTSAKCRFKNKVFDHLFFLTIVLLLFF